MIDGGKGVVSKREVQHWERGRSPALRNRSMGHVRAPFVTIGHALSFIQRPDDIADAAAIKNPAYSSGLRK